MSKHTNSDYWEDRIARETWKTYNDVEEQNMDLLKMYDKTSNAIKKELYALAETAEEQGGLTRTDLHHPLCSAPAYRLVSAPGDGLGHEPGPGSRSGASGAPRPAGHNACGGDRGGPAGHSFCASVWTAGYLVFHFSQHLCLL